MKTICIYHANCLDGFASAFILWKTLGPKVEFIPAFYGKEPCYADLADNEVYIVDFSYPADIMAKICEQAHYVTVIDHHESAIRKLAGFSAENYTAKFDITRAGTALTHEFFFHDREMHPILQMIANRDLWNFSIPGTKEICAAMWEEDRTFERWDWILSRQPLAMQEKLFQTGSIILKMNARNIEGILRSGTRQIPGSTIPICNMPYMYASEAGNILAQGHPFSITYFDRRDCRQYSLRVADGDFNVAKLAEMYGGGGHKKAAGFTVSLSSVSDGVPLGFAHSIAISQTRY
jgi:oligoribonuclease NrnB/cAMP/cGMP phosphodiesterase (DHH superfamily)